MFIGDCSIKLIAGSGHPDLVHAIAGNLRVSVARVGSAKHANGESSVIIGECLRDQDVYICQTGHGSVNDMMIELLIMISGCRAASARRITVGMDTKILMVVLIEHVKCYHAFLMPGRTRKPRPAARSQPNWLPT